MKQIEITTAGSTGEVLKKTTVNTSNFSAGLCALIEKWDDEVDKLLQQAAKEEFPLTAAIWKNEAANKSYMIKELIAVFKKSK